MAEHVSVLKAEVLQAFQGCSGRLFDGTFGGGGHTEALLERNPSLSIIAVDVDPEAAVRAERVKQRFPDRFQFFSMNFSEIEKLHQAFDGILLDLGVSSFQLETASRGFSFREEGALDMRMNPAIGISARTFLQQATPEALTQAIRDYGEEPQWRSIVRSIVQYREKEFWETTVDFTAFLERYTPILRSKKPGLHFATRVFQGLRIAVNDELGHLERGLKAAFETLRTKGVFAVIAFHSLEDRIVKQHFYAWCGRSLNREDAQPKQWKSVRAELLTRKPIRATEEEIANNPRSRSAKLRILRKL
ncbi:MAG: 16S rRNA (cytosine(1402)-N(4))-methyltransferase RsmH [Opitutales bacterium]|nr:16S rRNA (cytosine(1402)-N(4))-methyltransferase RsmH [Opitutales bacterium]